MFRNLAEDAPIEIYFETFNASSVLTAPSAAFTVSDFAIYKNGSATAKATTNGLTVTSPFNSETGCHLLIIDTSNDTGDAGFWTTGARYQVKFNTAKTVDSKSIDGRSVPRGSFGIQSEYEGANVTAWRGSTPNTLTSGRVDAIVGAYASGQAPLQPTVSGRTVDVTAGGNVGIDWANIESPTATNQFSGSYIALQNNQNVNLNAGAIQAATFAANAITASAIADGAIDTATFAAGTTLPRVTLVDTSTALTNLPTIPTNWLTAAGLAADAATEIGAAVLAALGTGTWATAIPWNAAWDPEVQSECADALNAYDPPTKAELDSAVTGLATGTNVTDAVTSIKGADNDTLKSLSDQIDGIAGGGGGGDATEATSQEILTIVEGLAASPAISVSSPVVSLDQSGVPVQIEVVQGADYSNASGTAITLNITGTFPTWADGTAALVISCGTELTVTGTIVTATGGTRSVRFDITDTQTSALIGSDPESPTKHTDVGWFDLKVTLSSGDITYPINRGKFISRRRVT